MKNTVIILTLAVLMGNAPVLPKAAGDNPLSSRIVNEEHIKWTVEYGGVLVVDSIPFSGCLVKYYADGKIATSKHYVDGLLEGNWITYYPDGLVKSSRMYLRGEKHGLHEGFYENGQIKFSYHFVNGLSEGTHLSWYPNGQLSREQNYENGYERGAQKVWRSDGKMKSNYVVRENGRRYGMIGVKRCAKIDSESGDIDPYKGSMQ